MLRNIILCWNWNRTFSYLAYHCTRYYLCACSAFPIQSRLSNLKSLAQVALELLTPQWLTWPWTTFKQTSRSFILVPIDFSYTTFYTVVGKKHPLTFSFIAPW